MSIDDLLGQRTFLTNPGTETYLLYQQGFELPDFCAFVVHEDEEAWAALQQSLLAPVYRAAAESGCGLMLDALLWRAHSDFVTRLGRDAAEVDAINKRAVAQTRASVDRWRESNGLDVGALPALIAADLGPRGDGYRVEDAAITPDQARSYHQVQIDALADAGIDLFCALTMTTVAEATGIAQAAASSGLPVVISPTVEVDGRLVDGTRLGSFIEQVDEATGNAPLFYMVNCAHPTHLQPALEAASKERASWLGRFRGFRANASARSHEELDAATELDRGDVQRLARQVNEMRSKYDLRVVGGCCGTDHEHLQAIAAHL